MDSERAVSMMLDSKMRVISSVSCSLRLRVTAEMVSWRTHAPENAPITTRMMMHTSTGSTVTKKMTWRMLQRKPLCSSSCPSERGKEGGNAG